MAQNKIKVMFVENFGAASFDVVSLGKPNETQVFIQKIYLKKIAIKYITRLIKRTICVHNMFNAVASSGPVNQFNFNQT